MHKYKIIILLSSSLSLWCMQAAQESCKVISFPQEILQRIMVLGDLQSLGRYGQVSHAHNQWYRDFMLCKSHDNVKSASHIYSVLVSNFDIRTKALVFYAKECKKNLNASENARVMFKDLWSYDDTIRAQAVGKVIEIDAPSLNNCLDIYAGGYCAQEIENLTSIPTSVAKKMKLAIQKVNSYKLKKFLINNDRLAVKTMLLADDLLFDCKWSGFKYNRRDKYEFGRYDWDTVLECACKVGDMDILNKLARTNSIVGVIEAIVKCGTVDLLDCFVKQNYEEVLEKRLSIYRAVLPKKYCFSPQSVLNAAEQIIALLFPGEIDVCDEFGRSLLALAIEDHSVSAVQYLLENGATPNIVDSDGWSPLYNAYDDSTITALLLEHGADVNQRNRFGRTALMGSICRVLWSEKIETVVMQLLQAGADVNCIDDEGKSLLHHYAATYHWVRDYQKALAMIPLFIKHGAKIDVKDHAGKTPFDYAQEAGSFEIMEMLRISDEEDIFFDEDIDADDEVSCNVFWPNINTTIE